ncbi:19054_t:CDS:1, partial [Racocetra fulgida]
WVLEIQNYYSDKISDTNIKKANREQKDRNRNSENNYNDRMVKVLDKP